MPYKHNEPRRHKIKKAKYRKTDCLECNRVLGNRGELTFYFTQEAIDAWQPPKTEKRGRPPLYSAAAVTACLMLRQVFRLPLRQTQGLVNALVKAFDITIRVPDFSSLSKRSAGLPRHKLSKALEAGDTVIVDSTGLNV